MHYRPPEEAQPSDGSTLGYLMVCVFAIFSAGVLTGVALCIGLL